MRQMTPIQNRERKKERRRKERQKRRKVDYCKSKLRLRDACEVNFACRLFSMARSRPVRSRFQTILRRESFAAHYHLPL